MDPSTQSFSSTLRRRIPSLGSRIPAPVQPRARSTSGDGGILQSSSVDTRRRRRTREHSDSDARLSWSGTSTGAGTGDQGQGELLPCMLSWRLVDPLDAWLRHTPRPGSSIARARARARRPLLLPNPYFSRHFRRSAALSCIRARDAPLARPEQAYSGAVARVQSRTRRQQSGTDCSDGRCTTAAGCWR